MITMAFEFCFVKTFCNSKNLVEFELIRFIANMIWSYFGWWIDDIDRGSYSRITVKKSIK